MNSRRLILKLGALGLGVVSACSFTVPSEDEVFGGSKGGDSSAAGKSTTNTAGSGGSGAAGNTEAGAGGAVSPGGSSSGMAGTPATPGAAGAGGEGGVDSGGAGGEPSVKPKGELINPSFEDGLVGWTIDPPTPAVFAQWGGKDAANVRAVDGNWVLSTWDMANPYTARIYQVIEGLEDGTYKLTAQVSNKAGLKRGELYAKNCGGTNPAPATLPGAVTFFEVSLTDIEVVGGKCEIGLDIDASAADWVNADLFTFSKVPP